MRATREQKLILCFDSRLACPSPATSMRSGRCEVDDVKRVRYFTRHGVPRPAKACLISPRPPQPRGLPRHPRWRIRQGPHGASQGSSHTSGVRPQPHIHTATYSIVDMGVGASRLAVYGYASSNTYTCKTTYSQYTYGRAWLLGTLFPRSLVVLLCTASFKGWCRTVREVARGPRREKRGLAFLLCDPCLHAGPRNLPVLYPFLDLIRKVYPFPRQDGEFNFLSGAVSPEGSPQKRRGKLPRGFFFGKPKPFD